MHKDAHFDGTQFNHFVKSGLTPGELEGVAVLLQNAGARDSVDGVVVRLERGLDLPGVVPSLVAFAERSGLAVLGCVKLADASLARTRDDDIDTARLAAEAVLAARTSDRVTLIFDTFMDIDRGYHPRNGFIDRMFNPRPALRAFAGMAHALGEGFPAVVQSVEQHEGLRVVRFSVRQRAHALVSGVGQGPLLELCRRTRAALWIDLCSGEMSSEPPPAEMRGLWLLIDVS